jgi:hypothetical protein
VPARSGGVVAATAGSASRMAQPTTFTISVMSAGPPRGRRSDTLFATTEDAQSVSLL